MTLYSTGSSAMFPGIFIITSYIYHIVTSFFLEMLLFILFLCYFSVSGLSCLSVTWLPCYIFLSYPIVCSWLLPWCNNRCTLPTVAVRTWKARWRWREPEVDTSAWLAGTYLCLYVIGSKDPLRDWLQGSVTSWSPGA